MFELAFWRHSDNFRRFLRKDYWNAEWRSFFLIGDLDVRYTAVSSFIFLRFFAPAILSPNLFQLTPHHPVSTVSVFSSYVYGSVTAVLSIKILSSVLLIAFRRSTFVSSEICVCWMTAYVKNLGGVGGTVQLWKRWSLLYFSCLTLMLDWSSAMLEMFWMLSNLSKTFSSCSYWEWGGPGQYSR